MFKKPVISINVFLVLLCLSFVGLSIGPAAIWAQTTQETAEEGDRAAGRRVLILHSYGTDFQWTRDMDAAIRSELDAEYRSRDPALPGLTIHSEMLDAKYHTGEAYAEDVARFLRSKYEGWRFDVIIVTDNFALEFIRNARAELWPGIPVVFAGINNYESGLADELGNATGVAEGLSVAQTLQQIRTLFPERVNVYVLSDGTATGRQNMELAWEAIRDKPPLTMTVRTPITVDSLARLERSLGEDDVALLVGLVRDGDMTALDVKQSGRVASRSLTVPVFSLWDFYMGTGIAGGYVASGEKQGRQAGRLAVRILAGEEAADIPVVEESPNVAVFDHTVLSSFGIPMRRLPKDSILYNPPTGLWGEYRFEIISTAAVFFLLVSLIFVIYEIARRRGDAAREASASLQEKETLLREIHHRVKNNLQVVSSMLNIQSAFLDDERSVAYFQDARTRIQSMALVHEHLYQSPSLSKVEIRSYVDALVATVFNSMDTSSAGIRISTEIGESTTDLDNAIPLGMLINELLSNAIKYAYPDGSGEIRISLSYEGNSLVLEVADHGMGLSRERRDQQESLGLQLVDALAGQLGGSVEFLDNNPGLLVRVKASPTVRGSNRGSKNPHGASPRAAS